MSAALELVHSTRQVAVRPLPVPWRDPQTVEPARLTQHIALLEAACAAHPASADLRTCLGMAHAMNYDPYRSMDALEAATELEPEHFFARFKLAELHYRLRALPLAEQETLHALKLAPGPWEIALARHQLSEIRRRMREGTQRPAWTKSLGGPLLAFAAMLAILAVTMLCR